MAYAEALPAANGGRQADSGYRFDRGTVESAVVVAVRRQELAASSAEGRP